MSGFDETIRNRVFSMAPQVMVSTYDNVITDWQPLIKQFNETPNVASSAPYIAGQGMLSYGGHAYATLVFGVLPQGELKISALGKK